MNKPASYLAPAYALIFPRIAETVRPFGYAAALHGSMANDVDIVLVPWTDQAAPAETVVAEVHRMVATCFIGDHQLPISGPEAKPHGRMAWCLPLMAGCRLDISVVTTAPHLCTRYTPSDMARHFRAGMRTAFLDPVGSLRTVNESAAGDGSDPISLRMAASIELPDARGQSYSIDADPAGIRARTGHAIRGAMAYGAMNTNPPPDGHWLTEFWNLGRAERVPATSDRSPQ